MRPIGYYVHHQGAGHVQRATAIARHLRHPCTLIGTFPSGRPSDAGIGCVELPDDQPRTNADAACAVPWLHYAPLGHDGVRERMARIASWIMEARPALMVIDVSVEVAWLARLCSTPFIYVRLAGQRRDLPHMSAFENASSIVAPFPETLDTESGWLHEKTMFAGFLTDPAPPVPTSADGIVIAFGRGGPGGQHDALVEMAEALPRQRWRVLGPVAPGHRQIPPNLELLGWREDAAELLARAEVVIGGAGDGLVAQAAALSKPFLCLPEDRAFDEQRTKAERLAALGAAVIHPAWPTAAEWPTLLAQVRALDPRSIGSLYDSDAVPRTAAYIDEVADRWCQ